MNRSFEEVLAKHCAPLLFGKKPAALFSEKRLPANCAWKALEARGFHRLRLLWRNDNVLTLIYQKRLLAEALAHPIAALSLREMGYPCGGDLVSMLNFLHRRFQESMQFPHEVGFFLGYPPDDVIGFMTCKGACKLCGQWKVYSDVNQAKSLFEEYARCRRVLLRQIESGGSIFTANLPALSG